jgi:tetratricopeptide (TPR) repeat protein
MNLSDRSVFVLGRLPGLTRARLLTLLAKVGGQLSSDLRPSTDVLCLAHSSAPQRLRDGHLSLPSKLGVNCTAISELTLRRSLGLLAPMPDENRSLGKTDLARQARQPEEVIEALSLFDVLEPVRGWYGYRDLVAAREVARLLSVGLDLISIVKAAHELIRSGRGLFDTRLAEAPWGELLQQAAGRLARLHGQYELLTAEQFLDADTLFRKAEELEASGDMPGAERVYSQLLDVERTDPVLPFNLGNVLDTLGRPREAAHAFMQALSRDPAFVDAWVNLGVLRKAASDVVSAERFYEHALAIEADHPTALFNLALLLTERGVLERALPLWERYLATRPEGKDLSHAKRLAALCRMEREAAR